MFGKILIANRGEIACRVMATAKRLGIATVAVYSEADRDALHTALADEAWPIGPAEARQSYLAADKIVDVARRAGAEAIHPGYGFLSESADFATACAEAGVVFIGPPPSAIRAMGSKAACKALMERSGVPLVPGYHGDAQDLDVLREAAGRIGFPVLIKASAGGGGKGMRVVEQPADLASAVAAAQREALASFGDGRVLIERYLTQPRHIEIQVFADSFGATVSLFERDCSIQRRHQKVIEEAPAPGMDPVRRASMGEAAVAAARAVGYVGAGTVEFIAEGDAFYFMEMNTRLQVEHPVTEMITGLDLVEWQFRVAAGERLPAVPAAIHGHAIEARVYAEDPAQDFLPAVGTLSHLRQPEAVAGRVRVDTGVRQGDTITPYYDPMVAKLIVWGEDRAAAVRQLAAALAAYEVVGPETNLGLLRAIADHPAYAAGEVDTGFIARHAATLLAAAGAEDMDAALAAAALDALAEVQTDATRQAHAGEDRWSPWSTADGWRVNEDRWQDFLLCQAGQPPVRVRAMLSSHSPVRLSLPSGVVVAALRDETLELDGVRRPVRVVRHGAARTVIIGGRNHTVLQLDPLAPPQTEAVAGGRVAATIPGRVVSVLVGPGDTVGQHDPLVVVEAMKMEMTLRAPAAAVVSAVHCAAGDMVEAGEELVSFEQGPAV